MNERKSGALPAELHPIPLGKKPFNRIHVDGMGPSVKERISTIKVKDFFERFEAANTIITDRETCFTARIFQQICEKYGVKHTLNCSRHHKANGLVERLNKSILPSMHSSIYNDKQNDCNLNLKCLERGINCTVNKSSGFL